MTKALDGKLALVTGAGRGIGAATAEALAAQGAHVVLVARSANELEQVEERIHAAGGNATIAPLDLTESDSIARLATAISGRWDALDLLVINAAMLGSLGPVTTIDTKQFNQLLTLNLLATQSLLTNFDPMLRRSAAGRVIALTSSVGREPRAFWGAYGASKAAMETLVTSYAEEVKNLSPIRVAIVDPGATATVMRGQAFPGEDQATLKSPSVVADRITALIGEPFETGWCERIN
jgi:NAD(P)-dependent dehydrogenase (short-subunit alcohol dehydrogenase family)